MAAATVEQSVDYTIETIFNWLYIRSMNGMPPIDHNANLWFLIYDLSILLIHAVFVIKHSSNAVTQCRTKSPDKRKTR